MAKDPATLFYWNDFYSGTVTMSRHIKGCYIDLLTAQFNHGALSIDEIRTVLGSDFGNAWPTLQKKFQKNHDGLYLNQRLQSEVEKRRNFTDSRKRSLDINNGDMVYIYLIKEPEDDIYKIGSSKYPDVRFREVLKYKPGAIQLWVSENLVARVNEKLLHEKFAAQRKKQDWFALSKDDIEDIKTFCRTGNEIRNENKNSLEERKERFRVIVMSMKQYKTEMLQDFFDYWSEHNPGGNKMLWEMKQVFDIGRRLRTWYKNENKYGNNKGSNGKVPDRYNAGQQDYSRTSF